MIIIMRMCALRVKVGLDVLVHVRVCVRVLIVRCRMA